VILLILNTLFLATAQLGCRPSKYGQDAGSERNIGITIGQSHVHFTIKVAKTKNEEKKSACGWPSASGVTAQVPNNIGKTTKRACGRIS
jgi:hypothetical protein